MTPLMTASTRRSFESIHLNILRALLAAGADLSTAIIIFDVPVFVAVSKLLCRLYCGIETVIY